MQDATTQFRGSNCFEERRGFMGNEEKKNITIADVAEALGVSKTTVSRAISGKGRIGQETRDRVLKYIEEHDYKPNVIAKGLAQSKHIIFVWSCRENMMLWISRSFRNAYSGFRRSPELWSMTSCFPSVKITISPRWSVLSQTVK